MGWGWVRKKGGLKIFASADRGLALLAESLRGALKFLRKAISQT